MIAIVDDDQAIGAALGRLVRSLGFDAAVFDSAEGFLRQFDEARPACVLTDVQMPGMNGLDLLRRLRDLQPDLPVLVMTAYPSMTTRNRALALGARDFLSKPFDDETLTESLERTLQV